jgi:hypothetical protein
MRGACGRGERPQARIGDEVALARMGAETGEMDAPVGSHHERRLLVALEGQSGAEGDDPQAQGRADRLKAPRAAWELFGQTPPVGISYPVAQDQGRNIVRDKWVHLPVPFCEAPV